ncbi:hypothetical protein Plhal304r1_c094g0173031 [Plasmopara halstedii]
MHREGRTRDKTDVFTLKSRMCVIHHSWMETSCYVAFRLTEASTCV